MFILLKLDIFIITYDHGQWSRTGAYVHLKDLRDSPLETLLIMELNVICFWIPCQYNHWGVLSPCEPVLSCVQFFASPWTYPVRCLWPWDYPARILELVAIFLLHLSPESFLTQRSNLCLLCLLISRWIIYHWSPGKPLSKEIIGQFKRKGTYWNWKAHIPFSLFFFMTWKYFNLAYKNPHVTGNPQLLNILSLYLFHQQRR